MGRLLSLTLIAGLAYGGLYFAYDATLKQDVAARLADLGFTAVEVEHVAFGPLAPLGTDAQLTAEVVYRGASASLDLRLTGHPLFSKETRLELEGLQALRLTIGAGQ